MVGQADFFCPIRSPIENWKERLFKVLFRYVGNLHKNASENVLKALFAVIGNVVDIKMINDATLSTSHYCFITYETHLGAQRALAAMNGRDVYKMPLKVNWATRPDGIKKDTSSKFKATSVDRYLTLFTEEKYGNVFFDAKLRFAL